MRTARLPIVIYLAEMSTRKVLTVNQVSMAANIQLAGSSLIWSLGSKVFDIMLKYNEHQDWRKAFETVIPPRKLRADAKEIASRGHKRAWEEAASSTASSPAVLPAAGDDDEEDDAEDVTMNDDGVEENV